MFYGWGAWARALPSIAGKPAPTMGHARRWMVRGRVTRLGDVLRLEGVGEGFALDRRQASSHNGPCQTLDSARAGDQVRKCLTAGGRERGLCPRFAGQARSHNGPCQALDSAWAGDAVYQVDEAVIVDAAMGG